jgi:hypothetical protein
MDWITTSWPWYVAGPLLSIVFFLMFFFGTKFGVSSSMETICSMGGADRLTDYFKFDWRKQTWNLFFVVGAILGGVIASQFMMDDQVAVGISEATKISLIEKGITNPGAGYLPSIFTWDNLLTVQGIIFMIVGGFFVGFGTRYAGGCTSGHAITGLSDLQLPSLIAVIGFFIGGLLVTHLILPLIL